MSASFEQFNQHRALLFAIAYRMLGSVVDASGHGARNIFALAKI